MVGFPVVPGLDFNVLAQVFGVVQLGGEALILAEVGGDERVYYDTTGNRRVKVGVRTAAKNAAKEKIKAAMHQVRSRYIPLAQYRERNAKLKAEIEDLDLSEVVPADMTYEEFQDLMIRPETPKMVSAVVGRDSFTKIGVPLREHVDDLIFQAEQQEKAKRRL